MRAKSPNFVIYKISRSFQIPVIFLDEFQVDVIESSFWDFARDKISRNLRDPIEKITKNSEKWFGARIADNWFAG